MFSACAENADVAADAAVFFLPGRMGGDTHRVRAVVDVGESLDVVDEAAPDGAPAAHRSKTIGIVCWRRVPIVGDWIVGAATTPVDSPSLAVEYKKAAMIIEPGAGVAVQDVAATWKANYQAVVGPRIAAPSGFLHDALDPDPGGYAVRFREFMDYWDRTNASAGFFGRLWERIKSFLGVGGEDEYREKCDDNWWSIAHGALRRLTIPDRGITALKFGTHGPHNQPLPDKITAGIAPAIGGVTGRTKALFLQFTVSRDTGTFIHEVGHLFFLAHAPGHFKSGEQPGGFRPEAHDQHAICLMSYHPAARHLCGLCLFKVAGWDITRIDNQGAFLP